MFNDDDFENALRQSHGSPIADIGSPFYQGSTPSQIPLSMAPPGFHLNMPTQGSMGIPYLGFPLVHLQRHLPPRQTHKQPLQAPPVPFCRCRLPATQPDFDSFALSQAREEELCRPTILRLPTTLTQVLVALASRIFPFMNNGFKHEVSRDSVNQGEANGITHHWSLYCARVVATDHDMISVTSQPMNTIAAAYDSLVNIMRDLKPVDVELTVEDTFHHDDGCCSRCKCYQEHRHPAEYSRYKVTAQKRFQAVNR